MRKIKQNGFSRVPVVEGGKIIGILMAKSCLGVDLREEKTLSLLCSERQVDIRIPIYIHQMCSLARIGKLFK